MSKKLVAYFSASGVTKKVALRLAQEELAELFEICPKIEYTSADLNLMDDNSRSSLEMKAQSCRPEILNKLDNLDQYEIIYLGFPIWWYVAPTIINTFLEQYDLSGKTIIPFATSGGSGMGKTNEKLMPSCKGAKLLDGKVLKANVGAKELDDWVAGLSI